MKGLDSIMQQAQKMQEKMQQAQSEIAQLELVGEAAAGLVKVTMTGRHDVKSVSIDQSLMTEKKDLLEDLLAAAVNDAVLKVEKRQKQHMSSLTGGMNLPEGFKMPF
ncbi:MAG: YbaB/EbfC family nucleoid-associated protein [Pseudomonadales bacterium]|nr:YbaB/EbfC family nucleoid-associated protein [Pseudomonadales bacterium]